MSTIVLSAGGINHSNLPISTNQSNAMVPVNGKPVIGWVLDDLLAKDIRRATVVLREEDRRLTRFLKRVYRDRMALSLAPVPPDGSIVHSLQAGLQRSAGGERANSESRKRQVGPVRVVLGDTLIRDSYDKPFDFVYTGKVKESRRWCLAVISSEGIVQEYIDKQEYNAPEKIALAGYYHFLDRKYLQSCVAQSLANDERELSFVLRRYGARYPIRACSAQEWYDFGHIDNLIAARQQLLQPRYFNNLSINSVLNTITKVSQHNQKLEDELDWYLNLPAELQVLTPRILRRERVNGQLRIVQEYYGYPTLAELYLYSDIDPETWGSILRQVLRVHWEFRHYTGELTDEEIRTMYLDKTTQRLQTVQAQDAFWQDLLTQKRVVYNGQELRNLPLLLPALYKQANRLVETAPVHIIHGDFCFSNILFDANNQIIRLIDPRGRFGRKGIYGDGRYDIAKLRHSVAGLYDYIVADMFEIRTDDRGFAGRVFCDNRPQEVAQLFDQTIKEMGYDLDEIRLIEGLLFISMLPYHQDFPKRQQMMFFTGLSLLNEVLA